MGWHLLLIRRNSIAKDFIVTYSIMVFAAAIAGVPFDGVDNAVLNPFNDAGMIGFAVLWAGTALVIPIEEDNHTRSRFDIIICPLASILEPVDTVDTACIFGNNTSLDIPALIGAPRYKAGAPLNTRAETVPAPVGLAAHIAKLRQRNSNNLIVRSVDSIEN